MATVELSTSVLGETPSTARSIAFRRVDHDSREDRAAVLELLAEHLGAMPEGADAPTRYRWLYLDNPHGRAATYLASDRRTGLPVGITSLFPRRVLVRGRMRTGAIGGDGFVRPEYRRRGIARALHQAAVDRMGPHEIEFMYGPPEPNNLKALLGAGSSVVGAVQRYVRPLSPASLTSVIDPQGRLAAILHRLALPAPSSLRIEGLGATPDDRVDEVFAAAVAAGAPTVLPVLDAEYCGWRFGRCPSRLQRPLLLLDGDHPVGVAALEDHPRRAALIDVLAPAPRLVEVLRRLLGACEGRELVELQLHVPHTAVQHTLLRLGFLPRGKKPFQVQVPANHPDRSALLGDGGWSYLWGDGDMDTVL